MSVTAKYHLKLEVDEVPAEGLELVDDFTYTHKLAAAIAGQLTATSSVPATKCYSDTLTIAGGSYTVDLTSMPGPFSSILDFTALKINVALLFAKTTNADNIVCTPGGTNPFFLWGDSDGQITLPPGAGELLYMADGGEAVAANAKTVEFSGTDNDEIDVILVAG